MTEPTQPDSLTAEIGFRIGDEPVNMKVTVPRGLIDATRILPLAHAVTNLVVDGSTRLHGQTVRCSKGCGACCRQLVPITTLEARALAEHVANAPVERRERWESRYADAQQRLDAAGLTGVLSNLGSLDAGQANALGHRYFELGIECPFLEDGACSVHAVRPAICREYLVTSDPVHCANPTPQTVARVPVPTRVSAALATLARQSEPGQPFPWLALPLAPRWLQAHPDLPPRPGPELLRELFEALGKAPIEPPPGLGSG